MILIFVRRTINRTRGHCVPIDCIQVSPLLCSWC